MSNQSPKLFIWRPDAEAMIAASEALAGAPSTLGSHSSQPPAPGWNAMEVLFAKLSRRWLNQGRLPIIASCRQPFTAFKKRMSSRWVTPHVVGMTEPEGCQISRKRSDLGTGFRRYYRKAREMRSLSNPRANHGSSYPDGGDAACGRVQRRGLCRVQHQPGVGGRRLTGPFVSCPRAGRGRLASPLPAPTASRRQGRRSRNIHQRTHAAESICSIERNYPFSG